MMFWLLASLLTLACLALLGVPLLRAPKDGAGRLEYDREIYLARMREIEVDRALGRLGAEEAAAATAEEGRRLIAASSMEDAAAGQGARHVRFLAFSAIAFVPVAAVMFYVWSGNPGMGDTAIASRTDRDVSRQSIQQLLERAEARLAAEPGDLRGWVVVAPVYLRLGRVEDAVTAYRNAVRLAPDDPELKTSLAESIVVGAQGIVTEEAKALFEAARQAAPDAAKPRFYLAIALGQQGALERAEAEWRALIADAPAQAPWLETARAQLDGVLERQGKKPAPGGEAGPSGPTASDIEAAPDGEAGPSGPTASDIEAASGLSAAERAEMIETMVAGLAQKLEANPQDKAGWRRLIRSYNVLGQPQKARDAIAAARSALAGDADFTAELDRLAATIEGEGQGQ